MHHLTAVRPRRTLLTLAVLAVAALPGGPVSAASPATSPAASTATDTATVILQMDVSPGFVPQTVRQLSMPTFTLYADGTAIYRPATGGTYDAPPPLKQAQLTPAQIDELLAYAAGPGGLAAADEVYDDRFVTDQATTTFSIVSPDLTKTVSVYALGFPAPTAGPNDAELAALTALGATLSDFDAQVAAGHAQADGLYQPTQYLATATLMSADDTSTVTPWPAGVDLPVPAEGSQTTHILTADQVAQVTTVPSGGVSLNVETPGGARVNVTIRPMLPDDEPVTVAQS
jgi:hypothetical protein